MTYNVLPAYTVLTSINTGHRRPPWWGQYRWFFCVESCCLWGYVQLYGSTTHSIMMGRASLLTICSTCDIGSTCPLHCLPTQMKVAGRKSYSLFGHFGITIGPRRPIRRRPVDSFDNNRMKAEKQEDCPGISPKSYVGILLIWTNGRCGHEGKSARHNI